MTPRGLVASATTELFRGGTRRRRYRSLDSSNPVVPYLFLLPHALFFFAFIVFPLVYGFVISLERWDPLKTVQPFVGFDNYLRLLDPSTVQFASFWRSFINTVVFVALSSPILIGLALFLALQLHRPIFGRAFFRSVFFLPGILSVTVISIVFRWIFNERNGLVNAGLAQFGVSPIQFLTTAGLAWIPIVAATVWWTVGFNMTLYLAGLSSISESYYEAAELDGAGRWSKFRFITWPLLAPMTLFVSVTTLLASFQMFGQSQIMTNGGPGRSTQVSVTYITQEAFANNQYSLATAAAFMFGGLMLIVTIIQFKATARGAGHAI